MGVRIPLERRAPLRRAPENLGSQRHIRKKALLSIAMALVLLAVGVAVAYVFGRGPSPLIVWELADSDKIDSDGTDFLLSTPSGLAIGTTNEILPLTGLAAYEAILQDYSIAALVDGSVVIVGPEATATVIANASPREVIAGKGDGRFYTARPKGSLAFGQNWVVRSINQGGDTLWEETVSAVPVKCKENQSVVLIASIDISSGNTARLYALDRATGHHLWEWNAGSGFWRDLLVAGNETVIAVLEDVIAALSADGVVLWTFRPSGSITDAVTVGGSVAVSYEPENIAGKLMKPNVALLSSAGRPLWSNTCAKRVIAVSPWMGRASEDLEPCFVALSETHVIGLSQRDGRELWRNSTGGLPVELQGEFLLVRHGSALRLVRLIGPNQ